MMKQNDNQAAERRSCGRERERVDSWARRACHALTFAATGMIFFCGTTLYSAADRTLECAWAQTAPVIDGRGDEVVWSRTASLTVAQVHLRLIWDRESLYFFADGVDDERAA